MNRKGSLEWSLETIGKLAFYAIILIALIYMSMKLIGLFVSGAETHSAERTLDLLVRRIEISQEAGDRQTSIIMQLPGGYALYPFTQNAETITIKTTQMVGVESEAGSPKMEDSSIKLKRPSIFKGCKGDSCICLYTVEETQRIGYQGEVASEAISCRSIAGKLSGGIKVMAGSDNPVQVVQIDLSDGVKIIPQKYGITVT